MVFLCSLPGVTLNTTLRGFAPHTVLVPSPAGGSNNACRKRPELRTREPVQRATRLRPLRTAAPLFLDGPRGRPTRRPGPLPTLRRAPTWRPRSARLPRDAGPVRRQPMDTVRPTRDPPAEDRRAVSSVSPHTVTAAAPLAPALCPIASQRNVVGASLVQSDVVSRTTDERKYRRTITKRSTNFFGWAPLSYATWTYSCFRQRFNGLPSRKRFHARSTWTLRISRFLQTLRREQNSVARRMNGTSPFFRALRCASELGRGLQPTGHRSVRPRSSSVVPRSPGIS